MTIGLCWGITVFGGYMIAHHFPQWRPARGSRTLYGITLFMVFRFRKGKWQTIHLENVPCLECRE